MNTQKLKEIANAYAAGCLDREDYPALLELVNSGNNLGENELGRLQNVITLLPAILEMERPDMRTKDKIARKLYRMREEVRTKKKPLEISFAEPELSENESVTSDEALHNERMSETSSVHTLRDKKTGSYTLQPDSRKLVNEIQYNELNDKTENETPAATAAASAAKTEPEAERRVIELSPKKKAAPEEETREDAVVESLGKTGPGVISIIIIALVFSLLSGGAVYYLLTKEAKKDKDQIASLSGQVNALMEEFSKLGKNQRVLALLGARDTRTFNLDGTLSNTGGFGKIVMTSDGKDGVLQLYNMPGLTGRQIYKLWAVTKDQALPMGGFKPKRNAEYFALDQIPAADFNAIDSFTLTLEQSEQAQTPSKDLFLAYTAVKDNGSKKK